MLSVTKYFFVLDKYFVHGFKQVSPKQNDFQAVDKIFVKDNKYFVIDKIILFRTNLILSRTKNIKRASFFHEVQLYKSKKTWQMIQGLFEYEYVFLTNKKV